MNGDSDQSAQVLTMEQLRKMREQVAQRAAEEEEKYAAGGGDGGGVDHRLIRYCLEHLERGDGLLFARLMRRRYVWNAAGGYWMKWRGHHWAPDVMDRSLSDVESVAGAYEKFIADQWAEKRKLGDGDEDREKQLKADIKRARGRVARLRTRPGRQACLEFARTCEEPLAIAGDEIDRAPWLLPCANGVIDLRSGELFPGRPEDYLLRATPTAWEGIEAPAPRWETFLETVFNGQAQLVAFVRRILGMALVGAVIEQRLFVFWGCGRNGKGVLVATMEHVLGDLAGRVPTEMLLDQGRARSSGAPSPDIMSLRGRRMVFASEADAGRKAGLSAVKLLTGADRQIGRNPHDKYPVEFDPSHSLFLMTNHKPHAPADDYAFWARMVLIPFERCFVDHEPQNEREARADKYLAEHLKAEAPGILAWLVRGCLEWQRKGLDPPAVVTEATAEYRAEEDLVGSWIGEECLLGDIYATRASALHQAFSAWQEAAGYRKTWTATAFGRAMTAKGFSRDTTKPYAVYKGIGLASGDWNAQNAQQP